MPHVLVVDDSAVERRLISRLLEQESAELEIDVASDGLTALDAIRTSSPELVLTDLKMPNMDGLQLVREIKIHHTDVPVILMTAHGSEATAIEALRAGAASYVPKVQLADSLYSAVRQVLSIAEVNRTSTALSAHLREVELSFELCNDPELIDPLVRLVQQQTQGVGAFDETRRVQMGVALEHALLNAMYRGNLELTADLIDDVRENQLLGARSDAITNRAAEPPFCDRRIHVTISLSQDVARFTIRDEGKGFDASSFAAPPEDTVAEANSGRGILLMSTLMDDLRYNDQGNEVTLIKRRDDGA